MISLIALCILGAFVAAILAAVWGEDKGHAGEMQIYNVLEQLEGQKAIISNCYLPLKDSGTTEVDLILIHESGIYVIESKNYSGWIFGSENHKYWTQSLPNHSGQAEKYQFYNPLWQNETHVRCLKSLLQNNEVPYYSYVVFGNNCEIKNLHLVSNRHRVTYYRYLLGELSENARSVGRCLTDEQINAFYALLLKFTDASVEQKARHIVFLSRITVDGLGLLRYTLPLMCPFTLLIEERGTLLRNIFFSLRAFLRFVFWARSFM